MTIALILIAIVIAGCGSVVSKTPTSAPQSRSAADVRADETQCESYAKSQPKIRDRSTVDHYTVCMIARGYGANFYFDELGLRLGVRQTRTHDAATVMTDMNDCDKQGDNTKATEVVVLTPEQEAQNRSVGPTQGGNRPNGRRGLVRCLGERGYALIPWVPMK